MDKNRLWLIGSVLVMAIVVGLGWFLGIAPQLASVAAADAQRAGVEQVNVQHEATLAQLKKDYANLGALNGQLASLSESVPSDTAMPAFVDEINAIASSTGVTVTGFAVADAKPYEPVSPPAGRGRARSHIVEHCDSLPVRDPGRDTDADSAADARCGHASCDESEAHRGQLLLARRHAEHPGRLSADPLVRQRRPERKAAVPGERDHDDGRGGRPRRRSRLAQRPPGRRTLSISGLVYVVTPDATPTATATPTPSK